MMFYLFYVLNALGYVCARPTAKQFPLRWFTRRAARQWALLPGLSRRRGRTVALRMAAHNALAGTIALRSLGVLIILIAFPWPIS